LSADTGCDLDTLSPATAITQPLAPALVHWFNHQTHHRGQAHAMLPGLAGRLQSKLQSKLQSGLRYTTDPCFSPILS
jgi:hypothetical protein